MAGNFNFKFGRDLFGKKTLPKKSPPVLRFVLPNHNDYEVENEPAEEEDYDGYVSTGMCFYVLF